MKPIFNKTWDHQDYEEKLYQQWETAGYFKPEVNMTARQTPSYDRQIDGKPFVIPMPPPNVTGKLHMGHALVVTIEDIMTRYHRLLGEPTLWLPGTDHAGIATQTVVDKALRKEGINKNDLGREKFVEKVWEWREKYGGIITQQVRRLGASCDWSRERFTLDEGLSLAVRRAFVDLYNKGLIYQGERVVNWCPKCRTAIADDEVEYKEQQAKLYYFKYDQSFPITIASTRPETKLGDTGVAVNPNDKRYQQYIGKNFSIVLDGIKRTIRVFADWAVDMEFGTGAVGVTPAHSFADWQMAVDNDLPIIKVIDENGRMTAQAGQEYTGLKVEEARAKLVDYLKANNLLEKEVDYVNNLSICYRCGGSIEPLPSKQWFVKMKPLAEKAKAAVEDGQIRIIPSRFEKVYYHWMDNIRDWCISRQLWWGHQIPVWYRQVSGGSQQSANIELPSADHEIYVGMEVPEGDGWVQDPDVLDTWFSSALWPFSTLGWPQYASNQNKVSFLQMLESDQNKIPDQVGNDEEEGKGEKPLPYAPGITSRDYRYFYPTTVMETGYDILFFWVARMIMFGLEFTGCVPFETVYLHGLVRDEQNRKMSKSLGNVLDPLDLIPKYGTDALRMALVVGSSPGQDIPVGESKIKGYRNFSNKIWNASRYVALRVSEGDLKSGELGSLQITNLDINQVLLTEADQIILDQHENTKKEIDKLMKEYRFSLAGEKVYDYFWHTFADVYIEASKAQLLDQQAVANNQQNIGDTAASMAISDNTKKILLKVLSETLVLLHPFMPYVTEAVWQELRRVYPKLAESIMVSSWKG